MDIQYPYCQQKIPSGTTWCSTCGANVVQSKGKYPIHSAWIIITLGIIPFATAGSCLDNGPWLVPGIAIGGTSFVIGVVLVTLNVMRGRK